ncbi:hypothetical protein NOCARDAX2BIS_40116 [Nocardioides sp. AX2bis]|nr:hypothetical protein NOCARDAX2BIS_40116 [Nocardioides sp. AX2bis]
MVEERELAPVVEESGGPGGRGASGSERHETSTCDFHAPGA